MSDEVPLTRRAAREAEKAKGKRSRRSKDAPAAREPATEPIAAPSGADDQPATDVFAAPIGASDQPATEVFASSIGGSDPPATEVFAAPQAVQHEPATEVLGARSNDAEALGVGATGESGPAPKVSRWSGFSAAIAKHPKAWMFSSLGVIFLLLATVSVFTGVAVGSAASAVPVSAGTSSPEPSREVPAELTAATALRTCSVSSLAADPRLLTFEGAVINVTTGDVLYNHSAVSPSPPASGLKVLTAAAALMTIGPSFQMSTRVFEGSEPGSIVLVGGGDPTLSQTGSGSDSVYAGAPKLDDLANQTIAAWTAKHPDPDDAITKVFLDASYWNPSDKWDPNWKRSEQREGWQAEVTALMVDGDRDDPQAVVSHRSEDPVSRAGNAFVNALAKAGVNTPVETAVGNATPGLPKLGEVKSQPISTLIAQMLEFSDNALGESIARVVSKEWGSGGSAASLNTIIPGTLANLGLDVSGLTVRDGSGLSSENIVPAIFMTQLMAKVATGEQDLGVIKSALPVAGKSGTLRSRFTGSSEIARGQVFAKTGWIDPSRTLSGFLNAADGAVLAFAFYARGDVVPADSTIALDALATGVYTCGNNLSNY